MSDSVAVTVIVTTKDTKPAPGVGNVSADTEGVIDAVGVREGERDCVGEGVVVVEFVPLTPPLPPSPPLLLLLVATKLALTDAEADGDADVVPERGVGLRVRVTLRVGEPAWREKGGQGGLYSAGATHGDSLAPPPSRDVDAESDAGTAQPASSRP